MAKRFARHLPPPPSARPEVPPPPPAPGGWFNPSQADIDRYWAEYEAKKRACPPAPGRRVIAGAENPEPGWRPALWEGAVVNERLLRRIRMRLRAAAGWGKEKKPP